jgi:GH25 family lysozyme M1 (1,4-beta-N-acetylmuramidase)
MTFFIVDASHYEQRIDVSALKAGNVSMVILKASSGTNIDPSFLFHYKTCIDGGMPVSVYHWADPIYGATAQAQFLLDTIKGLNIKSIWIDSEQWWANWLDWELWNEGKLSEDKVPRFTSMQISTCCQQILKVGSAGTKIPIGYYSNAYFARDYSQDSLKWIPQYPVWLASYLKLGTGKMTWDQFAQLAPKFPPRTSIYPAGWNVIGWQFTGDSIRLPGVYESTTTLSCLDVSVFDNSWIANLLTPPVVPIATTNIPESTALVSSSPIAIDQEVKINQSVPFKSHVSLSPFNRQEIMREQ